MTTLDEVIKRYTDNAEFERRNGNLQGCLEFRQLAEWLKDYKQLLEQKSGKWHIAHGMYEDRFWCSCGYIRIMDSRMNEWKYCPVCGGAKMESEE